MSHDDFREAAKTQESKPDAPAIEADVSQDQAERWSRRGFLVGGGALGALFGQGGCAPTGIEGAALIADTETNGASRDSSVDQNGASEVSGAPGRDFAGTGIADQPPGVHRTKPWNQTSIDLGKGTLAAAIAATPEFRTPPLDEENSPEAMQKTLARARENAPDTGPLDEPAQRPLDPDGSLRRLRKLVSRCTFGVTAEEMALAESLGYEGYLEYQLNPDAIADADCDQRLEAFPSLNWNQQEIIQAINQDGDYAPVWDVIRATITRAVYSKRQLFERVVEFWSDHFNVYMWKDGVTYFKLVMDRDVLRPHALGNFSNLLIETARSSAMLIYLDNALSVAANPNQNYPRELLELHTMSPGNYTQFDVEEVARCFTGWRFDFVSTSPTVGEFLFDPNIHDYGEKTVLGHTIPAGGGETDGLFVLGLLSINPDIAPITAQFIAKKLAIRFWGENPPQSLIQETADAYVNSGGDIKAMLRVVLSEHWIEQAPPRLKRPFDLLTSAIRALGGSISNFWSVQYFLELMGHHPFYWAPPDGYPDNTNYWSGFLLPRWRFGGWLVTGQSISVPINLTPFFSFGMTVETFLDQVDRILFTWGLRDDERAILRDYINEDPESDYRRLEALGVAIGMMRFQWY